MHSFELDDFLYSALLNRSRRDTFEESKPRLTSPLSSRNPRGTKLVSAWCWLCFVLDVIMCSAAYLQLRLPKINNTDIRGCAPPPTPPLPSKAAHNPAISCGPASPSVI